VRLKNVKSGTLTDVPADGVFIAIGHAPATDLVNRPDQAEISGYVEVAPNSTATSIPGLFAAGDVADETYRRRSRRPASAAWRPSRPNASWLCARSDRAAAENHA